MCYTFSSLTITIIDRSAIPAHTLKSNVPPQRTQGQQHWSTVFPSPLTLNAWVITPSSDISLYQLRPDGELRASPSGIPSHYRSMGIPSMQEGRLHFKQNCVDWRLESWQPQPNLAVLLSTSARGVAMRQYAYCMITGNPQLEQCWWIFDWSILTDRGNL